MILTMTFMMMKSSLSLIFCLVWLQVWFSNRRARWRKQAANSAAVVDSDDVSVMLRHHPISQPTLESPLRYPVVIDKPTGKTSETIIAVENRPQQHLKD